MRELLRAALTVDRTCFACFGFPMFLQPLFLNPLNFFFFFLSFWYKDWHFSLSLLES